MPPPALILETVASMNSESPILSLPPRKIAEELAMIEWKLHSNINRSEFFHVAWSGKDKSKAPNIRKCISFFNKVS